MQKLTDKQLAAARERCSRCGGLLYREAHHNDDYLSNPTLILHACINYGERIDALVLRNRARRIQPPLTSRARQHFPVSI